MSVSNKMYDEISKYVADDFFAIKLDLDLFIKRDIIIHIRI